MGVITFKLSYCVFVMHLNVLGLLVIRLFERTMLVALKVKV